MLKDLFEIPEHLSSRQKNWLNMVTAIPSVKEVFGDVVNRVNKTGASFLLLDIAYLHDVVEDTPVTLEELYELVLNLDGDEKYTKQVVDAVDALTKREGEDYNTYMSRVMQNKHAAFVKYYDSESNMYACILDGDNRRAQKYLKNMCMLKNFV